MSDQAPGQSDAKSGSKSSKILVWILVLLLVALAYDYLVARAGVDSAYDKIAKRSAEVNANATEVFTDEDVQKLLDGEPSRTFDDAHGDRVEVYSWRGGLPFRTHDLFVVYKPSDGRQMFYRHAKFAYETSIDVSPNTVMRVIEQDGSTDMSDAEYEQASYGGEAGGDDDDDGDDDGGAGGAERGSRGGPGRGMDPEAMFEQRDGDGDGLLKDDEIPDRARGNMEEIDTDTDGTISKDEWMTRMQAMRARSGGGDSRPEMEDEPTADKPTTEEPTTEEPAAEQPTADKPAAENPAADQPT
jgi:hypothetical protein